ncbi:ABC transporter permease [Xylanimonas sp. McL0601]|uniref:ABC transporter permease n=1 Tax=Xylanimonas sp. McL0601 TaxID=3414739 RepID=UPI003CF4BC40
METVAARRYASAYRVCLRIAARQATTYRASFLMSSLITLVGNLAFPLVTVLIYGSGAGFPGWTADEVLLIQSVFTLSAGLSGLALGRVVGVTMDRVREGTLEVVLLKPVRPLPFIILTTVQPESAGVALGGAVLMAWSASRSIHAVSATDVLTFLGLFLAGLCVMAGIALVMAATSFRWVGNSRLPEIADSVRIFGHYPLPVFPGAVQAIVTFVVPVGMVGFYPASALLGRSVAGLWPAAAACATFLGFGVWLYHHQIRHYQGVGG